MYPWDHIWDITNQVRAYENMCYVVSVNHTGAIIHTHTLVDQWSLIMMETFYVKWVITKE